MSAAAGQLSLAQQQQQQQQQPAQSPALPPQPTPPTPQSSFTPPSTRPRQLLHNVINTPPPQASLSQTQLHLQPIRPTSPTTPQQTSPPQPPPPPPPITTTGLNKPMPPLPPQSSSTYYPPVPSTSASASAVSTSPAGISSAATSGTASASASLSSPTADREAISVAALRTNVSTMSLAQQDGASTGEWTMERVVQWLKGKPCAYLEPLFVEHQIHGKAFVGLTNPTLKSLDPNSSYYQRRKLLLEIKDAVEGTKTSASVSSIPDNIHTPPPTSGSPVLTRLGSGSRPVVMSPATMQSPYIANNNSSSSNVSVASGQPPEINTVRGSFEQDPLQSARFYKSPAEETSGSGSSTPVALHSTFSQSRPSLDTLEPLEDETNVVQADSFSVPVRQNSSPRPMSDPDLRQLPGRIPAHVVIETTESSQKLPNITPRGSSIAYSASNYRANLNVPPQIVPRGSSREYSAAHGLNTPQSGRGMSPVSPPSPGGHPHYPYPSRSQETATAIRDGRDGVTAAKNGPSLSERRNNPSVPHIQTQILGDSHAGSYMNGQRHPYDIGPPSGAHSDATVVGGTLGFGRRPSHKRNHSSADVIQYAPVPAVVPAKPKSIQVTLDNENFKYVDITAIDNAVMLKERIFSRMRILAEKNKYGIFETTELGSPLLEDPSSRGPPLSENELMDLVLNADNKGSVKFLVTPIIPLILPPDMDILNPKRHPGTLTSSQQQQQQQHHHHQHPHYGAHGRHSPFSGAVAPQDPSVYNPRDRTADSGHPYQPDPYVTFVHTPDDIWNSVHPHQPYPDSKHPHNTGRHPHQSNNPLNPSSFGPHQQQMYSSVHNPAHPHYQPDDRRPSVGTNSARTSPRFGPVVNTSLGRTHKSGANSPGGDGTMHPSPLSGKRLLARNPNLSLVIGSNTDEDGKLVNHHLRASDRSASPGGSLGYRQPRDRMAASHDSGSPNASYYEMNKANHPGFGEIPMVNPQNYSNVNGSGLPASPLSAGATKRSSFQPVAKYGSSYSNMDSPRSMEGRDLPNAEMHVMSNRNEDDESENFWGERPPLDFLLENFGRFFQDHDLDNPIIELHPPTPHGGSPMVSAQTILGTTGSAQGSSNALKSQGVSPAVTDGWGSNSTMSSHGSVSPGADYPSTSTSAPDHRGSVIHKKSIRIVAQEAKDRFSRQYSGSKVMRRKSTKMWGSRLAEVMPTNSSASLGLAMREYDEELSPVAGSPAVVTRSTLAEFVKEAAQEHHILTEEPAEEEAAHYPSSQDSVLAGQQYQQQHQQQQRVVQVESGKVMDQSQQGIYQHPQSGTIKTFQYLKGGLIGRGSFGKVFHAFNIDTREMIAIKQVDLPQTLSERNCDRLKTSVEALFSEMEVLKDLDHENIVQYLGFAQNEETANIFLEYVSGGSIESCLKRSGPFPEAVIRSFTRQILLGLEYIHSKKIVHR
ncbi:hypothetical protein BGX28_006149, partial [Mortierella sp. GBA30]